MVFTLRESSVAISFNCFPHASRRRTWMMCHGCGLRFWGVAIQNSKPAGARRQRRGLGISSVRMTISCSLGTEKLAGKIGDLRGAFRVNWALTRIFTGQLKSGPSVTSIVKVLNFVRIAHIGTNPVIGLERGILKAPRCRRLTTGQVFTLQAAANLLRSDCL